MNCGVWPTVVGYLPVVERPAELPAGGLFQMCVGH
jgi:hypothetical protein